jgi:5,10-methylene-tetrahydrofolate dehydrogenase/methenyl tetrahydrofolate cyclohydrolase
MSEGTATIIDGKATAATIRSELKARVDDLKDKYGKAPGLAVVLVGERKDSQTYVRMKKRACEEVGIASFGKDLPADATEDEIVAVVRDFNADPAVHGILVQLPLPSHINEARVLEEISYEKDVDGLHPLNVGYLALRGRTPQFVACTPKGCIELLKRYEVAIPGKRAVVLGRSNIVGVPVAALLQAENATVTVVHSRTPDIPAIVRESDIVVAAIGRAGFVKGEWLKPGAVVVDVGINSVDDATAKRGYRLVGDVDFEGASKVASAITPVPGGVGPMTIAMLLSNTVESGARHFEGQAE